MSLNLRLSAFICGASLFLSSCDKCNNQPKVVDVPPVHTITVNAPSFNTDSAYAYIQTQVDFGPRNMNSKGHEVCAKWIEDRAKRFADTVFIQKFDVKGFDGTVLKCTNIIASFNPSAATRILLTTHWDTRPWADQDSKDRDKPILGACDGGSGVGILLEIARAMQSQQPKIGIDLFFNDAEDYGYSSSVDDIIKAVQPTDNTFCLGSQYWSRNPHVPGYRADFGVLLDMAGSRNAVFAREENSSFNAGWVQDKVWGNAQALGYSSFFSNGSAPPITDDHFYINQITKIPTIDIIPYDRTSSSGTFPEFWHTHQDNMDVIDKATLEAVGRTVLYTIYQYDSEKNMNP